jgi:hypothetical protein
VDFDPSVQIFDVEEVGPEAGPGKIISDPQVILSAT